MIKPIHLISNDKKVPKKKLSKKALNIFRTTQRNNIELTSIADNKANILLSLNALMITFLLPPILSNLDIIIEKLLYIPIIILGVTCFLTIYIAAQVLKPSNFETYKDQLLPNTKISPFFFGNFYKMDPNDFFEYLKDSLSEPELVKMHLAQDLYYVGKRLGTKMTYIRKAFNLFITGIFLTLVSTIIVLLF